MDAPGAYRWGNYKQYLSPKELEKMKKNMKKVPVIQLKSDIYHNQEANEAEKILWKIPTTNTETIPIPETQQQDWLISKLYSLRQRFISLF